MLLTFHSNKTSATLAKWSIIIPNYRLVSNANFPKNRKALKITKIIECRVQYLLYKRILFAIYDMLKAWSSILYAWYNILQTFYINFFFIRKNILFEKRDALALIGKKNLRFHCYYNFRRYYSLYIIKEMCLYFYI